MTAPPGLEQRYELYRRLKESYAARERSREASRLASLDTGALLEALVLDGASLREIGRVLDISHTAVDKILARYRAAIAKQDDEA